MNINAAEVLRAVTDNADVLGKGPDGEVYLLVAADADLFNALMLVGGASEDDEDDGNAEESEADELGEYDEANGDLESDQSDLEPDQRRNLMAPTDEGWQAEAQAAAGTFSATPSSHALATCKPAPIYGKALPRKTRKARNIRPTDPDHPAEQPGQSEPVPELKPNATPV